MHVSDVPETNARMLQELLDLARRYLGEGKPLHAGQVYRRVLKAEPALQEPYLSLSSIYWEAGQEEEAERILRQGVSMCAENVDCRLMLGDQLLERGDFGGALECYAPLLSKKLPQVHVRIAVANLRLGKTGEAEVEARKALALETRLPEAREILGEVLLLTRRPAEAAAELKRALRLDPYNTRSHLLLGQALLQNRGLREALDAFQMAVDIDP
ncbi:MAG: repeat protein, partial [Bacteroidetes bacterium]|nr:repeat protein [Bacteroidota bacterium]